jgi:hypothetical protein
MATVGGRNMREAYDIYSAISPRVFIALVRFIPVLDPSTVPCRIRHHSRHQTHITLRTDAVTGPRQQPWAPRGGAEMATNITSSGSGDGRSCQLPRTACHLPQGTKSLGHKVRVPLIIQSHACYTPRLLRTSLL